jgi:nitroreductase
MQEHVHAQRPALKSYLETRRSVPALQMTEPGPGRGEIEEILRLATRVPDHGKLAPWRFLVISGDARTRIGDELLKISKSRRDDLSEKEEEIERERLSRAPVVIAVVSTAAEHPKIPVWEQQMSAAAVCLNIFMAANALGFSANWLTEWYAYDEQARPLFGLEDGERIAGFLHIGSADFPPPERPRPDVAALTTFFE